MNIASGALVLAAVAVNFGWQPSKEDPQAYEVLMQVEPELVGVMAEGTAVPIESHVPKEVAPIRNIRVVVGHEKLPRTLIAAKNNAKPTSERIVRGQAPIEHTANFQADAWGPSSPSRQIDQRGATIGGAPAAPAETNPWTVENAQNAVNNAGNSLRNATSSSIDDVTNQFNQTGQDIYNKTKDAASDFGNQLQNSMGFGSQPAPPAAAAGQRYTSAPPTSIPAASTASATQPPGGWTTINPGLAPPRLTPPPLAGGVRVASNPTAGRTNLGPSFPPPPTVAGSNERSMLSSGSQPTESDGQWDSVWGTTPKSPATIGSDDTTGMVALPPRMRPATVMASQQLPPPPAGSSGPTAPPLDPRHQSASSSQPPANGSSSNTAADDWANFGRSRDNVFNDPRMPAAGQTPQQPVLTGQQSAHLPPANSGQAAHATSSEPPITTTQVATQPSPQRDELTWTIAISLALAGSLGANFYLGMSYAEARHRYRTLVAKTTHAFEKKAGLAA